MDEMAQTVQSTVGAWAECASVQSSYVCSLHVGYWEQHYRVALFPGRRSLKPSSFSHCFSITPSYSSLLLSLLPPSFSPLPLHPKTAKTDMAPYTEQRRSTKHALEDDCRVGPSLTLLSSSRTLLTLSPRTPSYSLFVSLWQLIIGGAWIGITLFLSSSIIASVGGTFVFVLVTWVFWLASAASLETAQGGVFSCNNPAFAHCHQLLALEAFSWINCESTNEHGDKVGRRVKSDE